MLDERALQFGCDGEALVGILSPAAAPAKRGVLVIVGGPQYRAGSHRQFALLARHLAEQGIPALRFDYRGLGDSSGAARTFEDVGADIRSAIDAFQAAVPGLQEVVLWGLCDGAAAALFYGHQDPRVAGLVLLNPWARSAAGLAMVRKYRPQVLWSTYPIASATLIGLLLHKLTGLPWVIDFRDPMTDVTYPPDPRVRAIWRWIERKAVHNAALVVCNTPSAVVTYTTRYPELPRSRFAMLENGYDEENFRNAAQAPATQRAPGQPFTLVHSGIIYPSERDPVPLMRALGELKASGAIDAGQLHLVLRATAHDDYVRGLLEEHGISDLVTIAPHVPYQAALAEMLSADGLLVLQATNCNHQIPAKLYEYLRAGRPILALTDAAGDTAATLRAAGVDTIAPLDDSEGIKRGLLHFLQLARAGQAPLPAPAAVAAASRQARTVKLAQMLDAIVAPAPVVTDLTEKA